MWSLKCNSLLAGNKENEKKTYFQLFNTTTYVMCCVGCVWRLMSSRGLPLGNTHSTVFQYCVCTQRGKRKNKNKTYTICIYFKQINVFIDKCVLAQYSAFHGRGAINALYPVTFTSRPISLAPASPSSWLAPIWNPISPAASVKTIYIYIRRQIALHRCCPNRRTHARKTSYCITIIHCDDKRK